MASMKLAYQRLGEEMVEAFKCAGRDGQEKLSVLLCAATQPDAPQLRKGLYQALADVGVQLSLSPYRDEQAAVAQKRKVLAGRTSAAMKKANHVAEEARHLYVSKSVLAPSNSIAIERGTNSASDTSSWSADPFIVGANQRDGVSGEQGA